MKILIIKSPQLIILISLITASIISTFFLNKKKQTKEDIKEIKILEEKEKPTINKKQK